MSAERENCILEDMRTRHKYMLGLLTVMIVLAVLTYIDAYRLRQDLARSTKSEIINYLGVDTSVRVVGVKSAASRKFLFFGQPLGKMTLYVANDSTAEAPEYVGYTFYYIYKDGRWTVVESGACSGLECQLSAKSLYKKQ